MNRIKWTITRSFATGLGLGIGRILVDCVFEPRPFTIAFRNFTFAFFVGFVISFLLYLFSYQRFIKKTVR
jgi:hypothetical protein